MTCVFALLVQICAIPGGLVGQIWAKERWPGGILLQTYCRQLRQTSPLRATQNALPHEPTPPPPPFFGGGTPAGLHALICSYHPLVFGMQTARGYINFPTASNIRYTQRTQAQPAEQNQVSTQEPPVCLKSSQNFHKAHVRIDPLKH